MDLEFAHYLSNDEPVPDFDIVDEVVDDLSVDIYAKLREEAAAAQRLGVSRNAVEYVKGRAELATFDINRPMSDEKLFKVSGLIDWISGDPKAVVDSLMAGRVRARVSAGMGVGKSTLLPSYIADRMDHRVLYVTLNANALYQCNQYIRRKGIGAVRTMWKTRVTSWVCGMTYHDFNAYAAMSTRANLFKHFETFVFDEAFVSEPAVKAALKAFAVMALPETNLLMCSANIRTDQVGMDLESTSMGRVNVLEETTTPDQAIASEKLVGDYLADRTLVILPSDERVLDMANHYESHGVDVKMLDTASHKTESAMVSEWLTGDSSTPRVLVAHVKYAIAFNFPLAFVIVFPILTKMVVDGDTVRYVEVPMPQSLVNQAVSRVGRGILSEASAMVMGSDRSPEGEMTPSEKIEEYVLLTQEYIRVRKTKEWEHVHEVFPKGLSPATAQIIRKMNLPAEVVCRYLAADGRVASKFAKAMMVYSQTDHYIYASAHEYPEGYDTWVDEKVYGSPGGSHMIKVPLHTVGEMQIVLHAISAIADGHINVEKWRLNNRAAGQDLEASDSEGSRIVKKHVKRLRKVRSIPRDIISPSEPKKVGWSFAADPVNASLGGAGTRQAVAIDGARYREAMGNMFRVVDDFVELSPVEGVNELGYDLPGKVELPAGEIESPGGSIICEISNALSVQLNSGTRLGIDQMKEIVQLYRVHGQRIVVSRLFDCFGTPWTSILKSFCNDFVVGALIAAGLSTFAYGMLGHLSNRFSFELVMTVSKSNVYKTKFLKIFKRTPTVNEVIRATKKGKFDGIAQSDAFLRRAVDIKRWLDESLLTAERNGNFLPWHYTEAQNMLPIHPHTGVGNLADGTIVPRLQYDGGRENIIHRRNAPGSSSSQFENWK